MSKGMGIFVWLGFILRTLLFVASIAAIFIPVVLIGNTLLKYSERKTRRNDHRY